MNGIERNSGSKTNMGKIYNKIIVGPLTMIGKKPGLLKLPV
jgi:hypothetical protein